MTASLECMKGPTPDPQGRTADPDQAPAATAATADLIALPDTPLVDAVVRLIRPVETPSVFNHSIRSYLFARLVAGRLNLAADRDYDDELLFAACAMHDLGVASDGPHRQRFEVEGPTGPPRSWSSADGTRRTPTWSGRPSPCTPPGHRGTPRHAVRPGPRRVALDFGGPMGTDHVEAVSDEQADVVHAAYPRLEMIRSLTDAIVAQAAKNPKNAPRYAIPGEFLRERDAFGRTRMEHACSSSRWGD
ncbi:metal-dependent phosphohydrolase [Streptomyces sp. M19]